MLLCFISRTQAQSGSVDTGFNIADAGFGLGDEPNDKVHVILEQVNGKIILGGFFFR